MTTQHPQDPGGNRRSITATIAVLAVLGLGAIAVNTAVHAGRPAREPASPASSATRTTAAATTSPPLPTTPAAPATETQTITEAQPIPHQTRTVKDPSMPKDTTKVRTQGVDGEKLLTYRVTTVGGVETARKLIKTEVSIKPVTEVVAVGTNNCDPNYSGCVPIASDVDCVGNGGDGPAYLGRQVRVIGEDIYRLDWDHDGYGCDE